MSPFSIELLDFSMGFNGPVRKGKPVNVFFLIVLIHCGSGVIFTKFEYCLACLV